VEHVLQELAEKKIDPNIPKYMASDTALVTAAN
jgi:hypothetical protein